MVRRDTQEKRSLPVSAARAEVAVAIAAVQAGLLAEAMQRQSDRTVEVATRAEAVEAAGQGFALIGWDDLGGAGELDLASQGISVRCLRRADGTLAEADDEPGLVAVVARSY
jgi:prolyl-tRNA synthetase